MTRSASTAFPTLSLVEQILETTLAKAQASNIASISITIAENQHAGDTAFTPGTEIVVDIAEGGLQQDLITSTRSILAHLIETTVSGEFPASRVNYRVQLLERSQSTAILEPRVSITTHLGETSLAGEQRLANVSLQMLLSEPGRSGDAFSVDGLQIEVDFTEGGWQQDTISKAISTISHFAASILAGDSSNLGTTQNALFGEGTFSSTASSPIQTILAGLLESAISSNTNKPSTIALDFVRLRSVYGQQSRTRDLMGAVSRVTLLQGVAS